MKSSHKSHKKHKKINHEWTRTNTIVLPRRARRTQENQTQINTGLTLLFDTETQRHEEKLDTD
jgi:hypothetical protein